MQKRVNFLCESFQFNYYSFAMPPKKAKAAPPPAAPASGKQQQAGRTPAPNRFDLTFPSRTQTLIGALTTARQKAEEEDKKKEGRTQILELTTAHRLLEEKYVTTSTSCMEAYQAESKMSVVLHAHGSVNLLTRKSSRKKKSRCVCETDVYECNDA